MPLRRVVLAVLVVGTTVFVAWSFRLIIDGSSVFDWVLETSFFAGAVFAVAAGAVLWDRQPGNRCAVALIVLGVSMAVWFSFVLRVAGTVPPDRRWEHVLLEGGRALMRPMIIWVLLAWPTGRLRRWEARFVVGFGASYVIATFAVALMSTPAPLRVVSLDWLAGVVWASEFMVVTWCVEIIVMIVLWRRFRAAAAPARSLMLPVVVASVLMFVGEPTSIDVTLLLHWTRDIGTNALLPVGFVLLSFDYLRYIAIPLILLFAASRRRGVRGAPLTVELGAVTASGSLSALIAESLGDPTARVLYPSGVGWVDDVGDPAQRPVGQRSMTVVERDTEVVAAVDHGVVVRPAALEAAAGTLVLLAEHRALEARTQARVRELRRLRATVLEAEDAVRRHLERDLHDGAQQQVLALALQSRLAVASERDRLSLEIDRVRRELLEVAAGLTEGAIRERGLNSFLEALAATSPIPVELCAEVPSDLDPPVAATAWFVASEAVGNAAKHAAAMHVTIDVRPVGDALMVTVSDDGRGGADPAGGGLSGLDRRVRELGGEFLLHSPPGAGTALVASLPLGST
jgi:signal transduction histidine kinase